MRRRNDNNYRSQNYNRPAANGNRYFDCNDIDYEENLSFEIRSDYPHHASDD